MDNLIVHRVGMKGQRIVQVWFKIFSSYVKFSSFSFPEQFVLRKSEFTILLDVVYLITLRITCLLSADSSAFCWIFVPFPYVS